jgi:hypothetical protein
MADETGRTSGGRDPERPRPCPEAAGPDGDTAVGDDQSTPERGRLAALSEPSLRAALLALGLGLTWLALSRGRQRRAPDLW